MLHERRRTRASRWISVIFLQGEAADKVLDMIRRGGAVEAVAHLRSLDEGDATTDAALTNGYVYDRIPAGSTDQTFEDTGSPYALTFSAQFRYVSFLRRYSAEPESDLDVGPGVSGTKVGRSSKSTAGVWDLTGDRVTTTSKQTVAL